MKVYRIFFQTTIVFILLISNNQTAIAENKNAFGMVTGSKTGTYIRFGKEMAKIAQRAGIDILVKDSDGSLANIKRIRSKENAAIGIVQSDVLGYLQERPESRIFARKLRLIFPFYKEEVHLFASKEIESFKDLQDKNLVIGARGSGNWLTTMNMLRIMGVKPGRSLNLKPPEALHAVLTGSADAMIYVAGKPVKLFKKLERDKIDPRFLPLLEKVHFVSLNHPDLLREYAASEISFNDYSWFDNKIPTVAVKAVLVSYDFSSRHTPYFDLRCEQLAQLGQVIRSNIGELKSQGHPKWQEVNLEDEMGNWPIDTCSRGLAQAKSQKVGKEGIYDGLLDYLRE